MYFQQNVSLAASKFRQQFPKRTNSSLNIQNVAEFNRRQRRKRQAQQIQMIRSQPNCWSTLYTDALGHLCVRFIVTSRLIFALRSFLLVLLGILGIWNPETRVNTAFYMNLCLLLWHLCNCILKHLYVLLLEALL